MGRILMMAIAALVVSGCTMKEGKKATDAKKATAEKKDSQKKMPQRSRRRKQTPLKRLLRKRTPSRVIQKRHRARKRLSLTPGLHRSALPSVTAITATEKVEVWHRIPR